MYAQHRRYATQLNIRRYEALLDGNTDAVTRGTVSKLLEEARVELAKPDDTQWDRARSI